jgi:hypothetical protein
LARLQAAIADNVIEKILRHCGLWNPASPRAPPAGDAEGHVADEATESPQSKSSSAGSRERTYVDIDTFLAEF